MTNTNTTPASPKKLRDGSWGALAQGSVSTGAILTITTRSGKSWGARVDRVIWTGESRYNGGGQISICSTSSLDRRSSDSDSSGNSIRSGDSYRNGVTAPHGRRCPECGDRECSKAWNSRDLCDED